MSEPENQVEMPAEQAADFAALTASAETADVPLPGAEPVPELPQLNAEIAGMLSMLSKMLAPIFPTVAAIYTDQVCDSVGAAVAPVCDKYGWLQGGIGGEYGPEIMCLVIVGPLAWATVEAGRTDLENRKPAKAKPAGIINDQPPAAPMEEVGQKTVQIGAAIAP